MPLGAALIFGLLSAVCARPVSYTIPSVPFHRQVVNYACGDACFEMVYHHGVGVDLDQRALIGSMRTTPQEGTLSYDLVRGAHFSHMSSAVARDIYPDQAPDAGYGEHAKVGILGLAYRSANKCWTEELKDVIAQGFPLIVLQKYSQTDIGGHYRVAVGYDATSITMLDPWDRNGQPHVISVTDEVFCDLWDHTEKNVNVTYARNFAALLTPVKVDVSFKDATTGPPTPVSPLAAFTGSRDMAPAASDPSGGVYETFVEATVGYPCPAPFCGPDADTVTPPPALANASASISLPPYIALAPGEKSAIALGTLAPGQVRRVTWRVRVTDTVEKKDTAALAGKIEVQARGVIKASVPHAYRAPGKTWPEYVYADEVGGKGAVSL